MSEKLDISLGTYQKYETGLIKHIDIEMVKEFAKALDVSPAVLLDWEGQKFDDNDLLNSYVVGNAGTGKSQTIVDMEKTLKALELYEKYKCAIPQIQDAVDGLLGSSQQDS